MRKVLSTLLTITFMTGSFATFIFLAGLRDGPAIDFGSPSALATVRAYYAAVNSYIETGEFEDIREVVEPTVLETTDLPGAPGELEISLRALRQTYPRLQMTIQDIHRDGTTVIAQVSVDAGMPATFDRIRIGSLQAWQMTETFTVADGRIASRWSSGPGLGLFSPVPGSPISQTLHKPGAAVIARLTFQSDSIDHLPILAPALIVIEQGELRIPGNGVAILAHAGETIGSVTEPGRDYIARPGDQIIVSAGRAILEHRAGAVTSLLIALFPPAESDFRLDNHRVPYIDFYRAVDSPSVATHIDDMTVEPIVRSDSAILPAAMRLISGWIVLTPGGSLTVQDAAMEVLIVPVTGVPVIERGADGLTALNPGAGTMVLWILQVEAQAPSS